MKRKIEHELRRSDLEYALPNRLIAQKPLENRSGSRLLIARRKDLTLSESTFDMLPGLLRQGDLLVMNDTRVFRARLYGVRRDTGGKTEIFLLRRMEEYIWKALLRPGRQARVGTVFDLGKGLSAKVIDSFDGGRALLEFTSATGCSDRLPGKWGTVPLPPYIHRTADEMDSERYQTVYASHTGAVAAPTAGLHFDREVFRGLSEKGVEHTFITLHVGPGTFQPLRFERLEMNRLDPEEYSVTSESIRSIRRAKREGRRIIAVGTTTTRVLESIGLEEDSDRDGETDLFIYPPYGFHLVDGMITNFHLPGSSLLCLVAAFMGFSFMKQAYAHAVRSEFRFYSYGDAMLIV